MSYLNQRYKGQDRQEVSSYLVIITQNLFTYPHRPLHTWGEVTELFWHGERVSPEVRDGDGACS